MVEFDTPLGLLQSVAHALQEPNDAAFLLAAQLAGGASMVSCGLHVHVRGVGVVMHSGERPCAVVVLCRL